MSTKRKHLLAALAFVLPAAAFVASPASAASVQHKPRHHTVAVHKAAVHVHHVVHKKHRHVAS